MITGIILLVIANLLSGIAIYTKYTSKDTKEAGLATFFTGMLVIPLTISGVVLARSIGINLIYFLILTGYVTFDFVNALLGR